MMESKIMHQLIDDLSADLDELESALSPLLQTPITSLSSKLPILDKAKLYTLSTYAIESLLFSHVRLAASTRASASAGATHDNNDDPKTHPVFAELARVRQYFDKVRLAENPPEKTKASLRLDRAAAGRFVKAALAGNDRLHVEMEERREKKDAASLKRKAEEVDGQQVAARVDGGEEEGGEEEQADEVGAGISAEGRATPESKRKAGDESAGGGGSASGSSKKRKRDKHGRSGKERHKSSKPPKGPKEAFQALLGRAKK